MSTKPVVVPIQRVSPSVRASGKCASDSSSAGGSTMSKSLPNHAAETMRNMETLYRQHDMCDVIIKCQGHRFRGHKVILASCAEYFEEELSELVSDDSHQCQAELLMDQFSPGTIESLLECMYTGEIPIDDSNVREILDAAAKLKFYAVEDACGEFLAESITAANCLRMLTTAFTYDLRDLENAALHVAARHFLEISDGFDYQQLDVEQLISLLERDDICADSELDVFKKALCWIESDKASRIKDAARVMQVVRLPLMSPADVVDHVETIEYLMEIPEFQKLVKEALYYHCLPARQTILQTTRTCPRSRSKREVVIATGGGPRLKTEPVSDDVVYYDVLSEDWHVLTRMPEPRHHHAVAVLGGFMYVAGGECRNDQQSPLRSTYRYDPRTNTWLRVANMRKARESFQLGVLAGMLYAVGGRVDQSHSLASVERYNPAIDSWEIVAPLAVARRSVAVAAHAGRLYAMGGSGYKRISSKVERYNPLNDHWEARRPLSMPRFFAMLVATGNKLLLFGGATLDQAGDVVCAKQVECYTPTTDTWTTLMPMVTPRAEAGFSLLGNQVYTIGGYSWDRNERLASVERYDVEKDRWVVLPGVEREYTGIAACSLTVYHLPERHKQHDVIDDEMYACADEDASTSSTRTHTARVTSRDGSETSTHGVHSRPDRGRHEPRHTSSSHQ